MQIGSLTLRNNLLLAPMAGVTDRPFRALCRRFGAGLAVSEMVSANSSLWGSRKSLRRLDHRGEQAPVCVQIVGADPRQLADAANANVQMGAQIIDINMGCPAKKVCRVAAGSALMQDEKRVAEILTAVVNAVCVPVTLKLRTGWDPQRRNAPQIARIAEECGIQALAIHGRTRACRFEGEAEYATIRRIKRESKIPVIANGDIDSPQKAKQVLDYSGADGIMIGRAARGRPWIFRTIEHYLQTGEVLAEPSTAWRQQILLDHLQQLYEFYGEHHGVRIARKHIAWYCRGVPGSAEFRHKMNGLETCSAQIQHIRQFFDRQLKKGELAA